MNPNAYKSRADEGLDIIANAKRNNIYANSGTAVKLALEARFRSDTSSSTGPVILAGQTHPDLGECFVVGKVDIGRSKSDLHRYPVNETRVSYGLAVADKSKVPELSMESMKMTTELGLNGASLHIFWRDHEETGENIPTSSTMIDEATYPDSGEPGSDMETSILTSIDESVLAIIGAINDPSLNPMG